MQPTYKLLGARVVGGVAVLIGVLDGLERLQFVAEYVPTKYAPFVYLVGFGVALLLIDSARKEQIQELSKERAAVRARYGGGGEYPFELTNVGQIEAHSVQIVAIAYDRYPWEARFEQVGSLAPTLIPELPRVSLAKLETATACTPCTVHPPQTFEEFLLGLSSHLMHVIAARGSHKTESELNYEVLTAAGARRMFHLRVDCRFADTYGELVSHHRLDCQFIAQQLDGINCVYEPQTTHEAALWL